MERIAKAAAIRSFNPQLGAMTPARAAAYVWQQAPVDTYVALRRSFVREMRPVGWQWITANMTTTPAPARFIRFSWTAQLSHANNPPYPQVQVDAVAVQDIGGQPVVVERLIVVGSSHPRDPSWWPGVNLTWNGFGENFCTVLITGHLTSATKAASLKQDTQQLTKALDQKGAGGHIARTKNSTIHDWLTGCRRDRNYRAPN